MKPHNRFWALTTGMLSVLLIASSCSSDPGVSSDPTTTTTLPLVTTTTTVATPAPAAMDASMPQATSEALSNDDIENLTWMREEEKLAHDVYVTLYELWDVPVFDNISRAETTHTEAVKELLDTYGIDDPAADTALGEFTNPEIQELYDQLVAEGGESLIDALEVGAHIEEMDILDLQARASDVVAIDEVYDYLERGSRNHLRAFTRNLEQRGVTYVPLLMESEQYEEIISTPTETGDGSGSQTGGNDRGRNGRGRGHGRTGIDS